MKLVLDASAALGLAQEVLPSPFGQASTVTVPDLFVAEVTNAVWKISRFQGVPQHDAELLLDRALFLPDEIVQSSSLYKDAFALALSAGHSAYDLFYLALARREGATLWTLDKAFRKLAARHGVAIA